MESKEAMKSRLTTRKEFRAAYRLVRMVRLGGAEDSGEPWTFARDLAEKCLTDRCLAEQRRRGRGPGGVLKAAMSWRRSQAYAPTIGTEARRREKRRYYEITRWFRAPLCYIKGE